jgi:ABC-type phosphonate transport system ATPase subunit
MIEAHGLVKRYGSTMAVNDLSFSIRPGLVMPQVGSTGRTGTSSRITAAAVSCRG